MTKAKHEYSVGRKARHQRVSAALCESRIRILQTELIPSRSQFDWSSGSPAGEVAGASSVPRELPTGLGEAERRVSQADHRDSALVSNFGDANGSSDVGSINHAEQTGMDGSVNSVAKDLQAWAVTHQITEAALTSLLMILRKYHRFSALPCDGRTLLSARF